MLVSIIIGIILLTLTLVFDVNPVEASVVNKEIVGTFFHSFLLVMTMPAYLAGLMTGQFFAGRDASHPIIIIFSFMFFWQIIFYGLLGKLIHFIYNFFVR